LAWTIEIGDAARKELKRLDPQTARRITRYLRKHLAECEDPRAIGKSLTGRLGQYWCYRVGDYRVICSLEEAVCKALVVRIGHRREVYR